MVTDCFGANTAFNILQQKEYPIIIQTLAINGMQKIKLPTLGNNKLRFKNYHKQLMAPFIIYADFEAILKPTDETSGNSTVAYQTHVACG